MQYLPPSDATSVFFQPSLSASLFRKLIHFQVILRRNPERIRHTIEESEHRGDVDRFGDLRFGPAKVAQLLHILVRRAIRCFRNLGHVLKQPSLGITQSGPVQIAMCDRLDCSLFGSLNTQEVGMRVQSIRTAVQVRNPACNRFFRPPRQVPLGEMHRIPKFHHIMQKVGPMTEALENAGHVLPARFRAPLVVHFGNIAGSVPVFNELDFGCLVSHGAGIDWNEYITQKIRGDISRKMEASVYVCVNLKTAFDSCSQRPGIVDTEHIVRIIYKDVKLRKEILAQQAPNCESRLLQFVHVVHQHSLAG